MQELIAATHNKGKLEEIKTLLPQFKVLSLQDIQFNQTIEEPFLSFAENAFIKANTIYQKEHKNCFADDSGICIAALNDAPGVHSARYAGEAATDKENLELVLKNMENKTTRDAYYIAVICLIWEGTAHYFEGKCNGTLLTQPKGNGGFGYDPIFVPNSSSKSFAEWDLAEKNKISHRGVALNKMVQFINTQLI